MSKWLKTFLFGIWGLLLIPLFTPILGKWLDENVFANSNRMATTVLPDAMATTVLNNLFALGQQRWFKFALVFLTGTVIGVSLEWLSRKSDKKGPSSSEASAPNFAVFQITSKFGPRRQDGPTMCAILNPQCCLYLSPRRNLIYGHRMSTFTNCRMRHSFVNTSNVSVSFWRMDALTRPTVRRSPGNHFSIKWSCLEFPYWLGRRIGTDPSAAVAQRAKARNPPRSLIEACSQWRVTRSADPLRVRAARRCAPHTNPEPPATIFSFSF